MAEYFLDLRDKPRVIDFLVDNACFANEKDRAPSEAAVKLYQDGERVSTDKLIELARKLAIASWPARFAIKRYIEKEGQEEEWAKTTALIRPSTAHLLKRLRQGLSLKTLDEVLNHHEASTALREEEQREIEHARQQVHEDIWKLKSSTLSKIVKDGDKELQSYTKRLRALRDLAGDVPQLLQDEVFAKLRHYEDRIMFAGEVVPLEILDEEVKYYTEQKEISPLEA